MKGTHRTTATVGPTAILIPAGGTLTIPKQPVQGGVGGNPWIYIQLFDDSGNLTPEILLGRCVQGLTVKQDVLNAAKVSTLIAASDCSNNPGPYITFGGGVDLSGMKARIIFKNNVPARSYPLPPALLFLLRQWRGRCQPTVTNAVGEVDHDPD